MSVPPQVSLRHKVGQTVLPLKSSGGKEERHGQGGESLAGNKQGGKDSRIGEIREGVGWSPASTAWGFLRASPGQGHSKGAWTGFRRGCFRKSAEQLSRALSLPGHRASRWHL